MGRLFGTDGVRGVANRDLSPELAQEIGRAAAHLFGRGGRRTLRGGAIRRIAPRTATPRIVLGKDPRLSGDMLEGALVAGICSSGGNVLAAGIIPTPGISFLTRALRATAGAVISASHNPVEDNGIKFFERDGAKCSPSREAEIEALVREGTDRLPRPTGENVGRVVPITDPVARYVRFLTSTVRGRLTRLKVVLDCAHGATCEAGPAAFRALGALVVVLHGEGDGRRINVGCGSTDPARLRRAVLREKADVGFAFDGDGDRVIAADHRGGIVNGDRLMLLLGTAWKKRRRLKRNLVIITVMSNWGLEEALRRRGIAVGRTPVGDRCVYEEMRRRGAVVGGEQSGHVLLLDHAATGDGILTALQVAAIMTAERRTLADLTGEMQELPQLLLNVRALRKEKLGDDQRVGEIIRECESRLRGRGRLLVRPSGTEPFVRVMAEGPDQAELREVVKRVASVIEARLR